MAIILVRVSTAAKRQSDKGSSDNKHFLGAGLRSGGLVLYCHEAKHGSSQVDLMLKELRLLRCGLRWPGRVSFLPWVKLVHRISKRTATMTHFPQRPHLLTGLLPMGLAIQTTAAR